MLYTKDNTKEIGIEVVVACIAIETLRDPMAKNRMDIHVDVLGPGKMALQLEVSP